MNWSQAMPRWVDALLRYSRAVTYLGKLHFPAVLSRPSTNSALNIPVAPKDFLGMGAHWRVLGYNSNLCLLHWYIVAAEIDSNWSRSLLDFWVLGTLLPGVFAFALSLWCAACDFFFFSFLFFGWARRVDGKELGEWWHYFCRLSLHEVALFIIQNISIILKVRTKQERCRYFVYGGQSLHNSLWLPFGIKRVNLVNVWCY